MHLEAKPIAIAAIQMSIESHALWGAMGGAWLALETLVRRPHAAVVRARILGCLPMGCVAFFWFLDYRTNVAAYPKWQTWLQKTRPQLLVLWGKHDPSFDIGEPERYRKDVPNAKVAVLDAGHFALDTKADEIAALLREFMQTQE